LYGFDAIHYKIKEDGRYISKAVYTILDVNPEGKKEILELYLSENEGVSCVSYIRSGIHSNMKHQKAFMKDLKLVYKAVSKETAELELDRILKCTPSTKGLFKNKYMSFCSETVTTVPELFISC